MRRKSIINNRRNKIVLFLIVFILFAFVGYNYYFKQGVKNDNTINVSKADEILQKMTLEEKIYQLFIVIPEQIDNPNLEHEPNKFITIFNNNMKQNVKKYPVGGIVLFSNNIVSPTQCTQLISNFNKNSKVPLFVSVDEEGGIVSRISSNSEMGTTKFPNMVECQTKEEAYNIGYTIGSEISRFGFNLDFAPVADINSNPNNPVIGKRSFGTDKDRVAEFVSWEVKGFKDSKTLCTLKHFPGHGDTQNDTHKGYASIDKTLEELENVELLPFKRGIKAGADFVMIGHLSVPKVTKNDVPATLSDFFISYLKNELGFKGIVITDAMRMKAITDNYTSDEAAVLAINAGVDVILMPEKLPVAANGILNAVKDGRISEKRIDESTRKIIEKKIESGIIK